MPEGGVIHSLPPVYGPLHGWEGSPGSLTAHRPWVILLASDGEPTRPTPPPFTHNPSTITHFPHNHHGN